MQSASGRYTALAVCFMLLLHATLVAWGAYRQSPTVDEPGHMAAGVSHWQTGHFELYRVNPPLVRLVATCPIALSDCKANWSGLNDFNDVAVDRRCFLMGAAFVAANGHRAFWYFTLARWACIPFSLLGGYVCCKWAYEIYGRWACLLAAALWCFSPNIMAHGQMITPDAGATAMGVIAAYLLWRWLKEPGWARALSAGLVFGLAQLAKATWSVLFLLWPVLWFVWRWPEWRSLPWQIRLREGSQMAVILLLGLYVLNLGYGFEGSLQKLGDYQFVSEMLGGPKEDRTRPYPPGGRNRFEGAWLGHVPVPLPKNYVMGIDVQKQDFEGKKWSYLRGEWRYGGWWYYYLYALAIKVPLGTWTLLLLAALVGLFRRGYAAQWRDELVLLAPLLAVLTLVSSQTGFNNHMRYVLPIFPFAFIWISKVARAVELGHRKVGAIAGAAILWSVMSSIWIYPHSLSYFNELVGGSRNGHAHLGGVAVDSNIDWGQDLLYLKRWLDNRPEARPLYLASGSFYDPGIAGIEYTHPPIDPQPGWYALSVNRIRSRTREYEYFLRFEPVAMAGYSIYIYHITLDEATRVRRELGLPELPASGQKERPQVDQPESES